MEISSLGVSKDGVVDIEAAAMMYERIALALRPVGEPEARGTDLQLAWRDVRGLVPAACLTREGQAETGSGRMVGVAVDDLYEQLGRGRVSLPVNQLLSLVPSQWVTPDSHTDASMVDLPLRLVVPAVPRIELNVRTAKKARTLRTEGLPNMFERESHVSPGAEHSLPSVAPSKAGASKPASGSDPNAGSQHAVPAVPVRFGLRQRGSAPGLASLTEPRLPSPADVPEEALPESVPQPGEVGRIADAISTFKNIEMALGGAGDAAESLPGVELRFDEILQIIPRQYVASAPGEEDRRRKIRVIIENLREQLTQGRVAIPVSQLIYNVPPELLDARAFEDASLVVLPLPMIVRAVGPGWFGEGASGGPAPYRTERLPDLFAEHIERQEELASAKEEALPQPAAPAAHVLVEGPETEGLGGVNLNTATADQLRTLPGVTPHIAERIVAYRAERGPFLDVFDLHQVPGIGRKTFRAITGMAHSGTGRHRILRLAALLHMPLERAAHLPAVAGCFAAAPGFSGCVISDADGLLLASAGADQRAVETSAVTPRLIRQVSENMKEVGAPTTDALTILSQGRMITVVPGEHVFVTAIHDARRLTAGQLRFVQSVACELQWLVSRRGYV